MMPRKENSTAIRFKADHNHVTVEKTTVYRAGDAVEKPSADLIASAGDKIEAAEPGAESPGDGE